MLIEIDPNEGFKDDATRFGVIHFGMTIIWQTEHIFGVCSQNICEAHYVNDRIVGIIRMRAKMRLVNWAMNLEWKWNAYIYDNYEFN